MATKRKDPADYLKTGAPDKYKPEYCALTIKLGKQGKLPAQIASKIGVSKQTLFNWADRIPEFFDALHEAKTHCEAKELDTLDEEGFRHLGVAKFRLGAYHGVTETQKKEINMKADVKTTKVSFADREDGE